MTAMQTIQTAQAAIWDHPNPFTLSHSSQELLSYCKRKFEFRKRFIHAKEEEDNSAGDVGKALHRGWQHFLIHGNEEEAVLEFMLSYPIFQLPDVEDERSLEACYGTLQKLIRNFAMSNYQLATIKCLDGVVRPAVEVEFEIWINGPTIDGRPICYHGFIDAIFYNPLNGEWIVVDLKTTRKRDMHLSGEYLFHGQCLPYGIVLQHLAEQPVERFQAIYLNAYIDILEPNVMPFQVTKTENDVRDWFTNLFFDINSIREYYSRDYFPRRQGGCMSYKKPCYWLGLCSNRDTQNLQGYLLSAMEVPAEPMPRNPWMRFVLDMPIVGLGEPT